jgi:hypothetical protein
MLQWRRWLANDFGGYLVPSLRGAPRPLLSLTSLPFPPSHRNSSSSAGNRGGAYGLVCGRGESFGQRGIRVGRAHCMEQEREMESRASGRVPFLLCSSDVISPLRPDCTLRRHCQTSLAQPACAAATLPGPRRRYRSAAHRTSHLRFLDRFSRFLDGLIQPV